MTDRRALDPRALIGDWSFSRTVVDARSGETSFAQGGLSIQAAALDRLSWKEHGTWWRAGVATPVTRALALLKEGDAWTVAFEDGRHFHDWVFDEALVHTCTPDGYSGRMTEQNDGWSTTWRATGPHKHYTMTTSYTRRFGAG